MKTPELTLSILPSYDCYYRACMHICVGEGFAQGQSKQIYIEAGRSKKYSSAMPLRKRCLNLQDRNRFLTWSAIVKLKKHTTC